MTRLSHIPSEGRALTPEEHDQLARETSKLIETSHLFKSLDEPGRHEVLQNGYVAPFAAGETLLRQDEHGETMYVVLHGTVRVETEDTTGKVHLAELGHGACVGEVSFMTDEPRTATVTAITDVDAVAFERHRIERVLDRYPKVRDLLQSLVEQRAQDTIRKTLG